MPPLKARYHPYLFLFITLCAMAQLGLTSYLINLGNQIGFAEASYHSLLILFLFNSVWTVVFGVAYTIWIVNGDLHLLASMASSFIWLFITSVLWGSAAGVLHKIRGGESCSGHPAISRCRQSQTVEAVGWTEFGLCLLTFLSTTLWILASKTNPRNSYYGV
jgi:tellurite resistance protein TehA-like permease